MTCRDCFHYEACGGMIEFMGRVGKGVLNNADKLCNCFKDKSRYIELPCKLRDKVWVISKMCDWANGGFKRIVCEGEIYKLSYSSLTTPTEWIGYVYDSPHFGQTTGYDRIDLCLGKTVFFTREEAEAAIKENGKSHEDN